MDSTNAMNIFQQFSQLMLLQSLAAASGKPSMNPALFGFPQSQSSQSNLSFPTQVKPLLQTLSPSKVSDPSAHLQTISKLLSSHQTLKSQLSPSGSDTSFKGYNDYENFQPQQHRQYKVHVNRESAKPLQDWMNAHITDPYPTRSDVKQLSMQTGFTFKQIRNWFTNNRRRYEEKCGPNAIPWIKKDSPNSKKVVKLESAESSIISASL
uniref:Homeobox domain-containing protein n=1 Tax=Panagrolaimus sp. PS1159 TaxID=55785 RepID=A0AC35GDY2_9BILA